MKDERFLEAVDRIFRGDPRYSPHAYEFISDAVTYTVKKLNRNKRPRGERHVNGKELVQGVAEYSVEQFGPLAESVLADWGLNDGAAIGNVVFNLIKEGLLKASDEDKLEDFEGTTSALKEAVRKPFEAPSNPDRSVKPPIIE